MLQKWERVLCIIFLTIGSISDCKKREIASIGPALMAGGVLLFRLQKGNLEIFEVSLALIPAILLWLLRLVSSRQIGFGDVLMVGALGIVCYFWRMLRILTFASIAVSLVGIAIIVIKKGKKEMTIPFIPFLLLGFLVEDLIETSYF